MGRRTTKAKVMYKGKPIYFDDPQEANLAREIIAGADGDLLFNQQDTLDNISAAKGYFAIVNDAFTDSAITGTLTELTDDDANTWLDVNLTPSADGIIDQRPQAMVDANAVGVGGSGTQADPYGLLLGGLTESSFGDFRAALRFNPDEDNAELSVRLKITQGNGDITFIEDVAGTLTQGAEIDYVLNPSLSFFIEDTSPVSVCLQVNSTVAGDLFVAGFAWYLFT